MAFVLSQDDAGNARVVANGGGSEVASVFVQFAPGVDLEIGRGATDTDRTYIAVRRSDGTKVYIYVDTGTTVTASTTKP